jgi:hypothetical protein
LVHESDMRECAYDTLGRRFEYLDPLTC